jgi:hypothetical protein
MVPLFLISIGDLSSGAPFIYNFYNASKEEKIEMIKKPDNFRMGLEFSRGLFYAILTTSSSLLLTKDTSCDQKESSVKDLQLWQPINTELIMTITVLALLLRFYEVMQHDSQPNTTDISSNNVKNKSLRRKNVIRIPSQPRLPIVQQEFEEA